jgi:hypothetical protein
MKKRFTFSFRLKILNIFKMQAKNHEINYTLFVIFKPYYTPNCILIKERKKGFGIQVANTIKVVRYLSQLPKNLVPSVLKEFLSNFWHRRQLWWSNSREFTCTQLRTLIRMVLS